MSIMWHPRWVPFSFRPLLGAAAVLCLATGFAAVPTDLQLPVQVDAATTPPVDRDGEVSRDDSRPALLPDVVNAAAQREAALSKTEADIAARERALRVSDFVKERAAAEKKLRYAEKVKKLGYDPKTSDPKDIAKQLMKSEYGWGDDEFTCVNKIWTQESQWKWNADNPTSSAYGIPQALPGSKMASEGADWKTNPATQIKWGLKYIKNTYGTPCQAWGFKAGHGWY